MKTPKAAEVHVRVGGMGSNMPKYTMAELEAEVEKMEAETAAANGPLNAKAIWDKWNRRK